MTIAQIAEWLEATAISLWIRESLYGFAIVVAVHIMGLTLSVGSLLWFDLRLLGVGLRRCPVSAVYRRLLPWFAAGFLVMFTSGGLLMAAFAGAAFANTAFRVKLAVIALAAVNALVYHSVTERGIAGWDRAATPPLAVRAAGAVSIAAWVSVILAGRMMSYTMF